MLDRPKVRIAAHIEKLVERKIDIVVPGGLDVVWHGPGPDVGHVHVTLNCWPTSTWASLVTLETTSPAAAPG